MQCPELFSPTNASGCVYDCTQSAMFTLTTEGGQAKCVYTPDTTKFVTLNPLNAIPIPTNATGTPPVPTLQALQTEDPPRFTLYNNELTRVNTAITTLLGTISREQRLHDTFTALQQAEDTRDSNPEGYQLARNAYYTLKNGDDWIDTERQRLLDAEVTPETDRYRSDYEVAMAQKNGQQRTLDIINSVKDRVLSMKDDFQYTTSMFKSQLDKLKSQLNIERRGRQAETSSESTTTFYKWFNTLLNLCIAVALVYGALTIWTKVRRMREQRWTTYTLPPAKA